MHSYEEGFACETLQPRQSGLQPGDLVIALGIVFGTRIVEPFHQQVAVRRRVRDVQREEEREREEDAPEHEADSALCFRRSAAGRAHPVAVLRVGGGREARQRSEPAICFFNVLINEIPVFLFSPQRCRSHCGMFGILVKTGCLIRQRLRSQYVYNEAVICIPQIHNMYTTARPTGAAACMLHTLQPSPLHH